MEATQSSCRPRGGGDGGVSIAAGFSSADDSMVGRWSQGGEGGVGFHERLVDYNNPIADQASSEKGSERLI